jgi:hypothetical protein
MTDEAYFMRILQPLHEETGEYSQESLYPSYDWNQEHVE